MEGIATECHYETSSLHSKSPKVHCPSETAETDRPFVPCLKNHWRLHSNFHYYHLSTLIYPVMSQEDQNACPLEAWSFLRCPSALSVWCPMLCPTIPFLSSCSSFGDCFSSPRTVRRQPHSSQALLQQPRDPIPRSTCSHWTRSFSYPGTH